ncbi:MAG: hypothetical protein QOG98_992 [Pseudonocardiales bacterium]|nr:hypothetical protein [Pseudonocardiales bacterium]
MPPSGVVELVAPHQQDRAGLDLRLEGVRDRTSCSRVETNDSAAALSKHDLTRPIDCRMPSLSLHRRVICAIGLPVSRKTRIAPSRNSPSNLRLILSA